MQGVPKKRTFRIARNCLLMISINVVAGSLSEEANSWLFWKCVFLGHPVYYHILSPILAASHPHIWSSKPSCTGKHTFIPARSHIRIWWVLCAGTLLGSGPATFLQPSPSSPSRLRKGRFLRQKNNFDLRWELFKGWWWVEWLFGPLTSAATPAATQKTQFSRFCKNE